jgi:hypothetical protein
MTVLIYAFLALGFILGSELRHYLPTHRRNWRFWTIIVIAVVSLYIIGHSIFPPELSVSFVLTLSVIVGFAQQWIAPILRRLVPARLRSAMPYLAVGFVIILILTFVRGYDFMASAITVGMLLAIFGGLWHLVVRLLK